MSGLVALILSAILFSALAALAVIDARKYVLPDKITLPLIAAGVLAGFILSQPVWLHALGAVIGYVALIVIEKSYQRARGRPGLGRGDAKLFAAGGAWCGALALPAILLLSSLAALCFALLLKYGMGRRVTRNSVIAFGPFLAFGIALVWSLQRLGLSGPAGF